MGSGSLIRTSEFAGLFPVSEEMTFTCLPETRLLHLQLWCAGGTKTLQLMFWGADGGGGGCGAMSGSGRIQCSGGGGGGGFAMGWISKPQSNYQYFVAEGARGGTGTLNATSGKNADLSWFSNPAHLYAFGGGGGSVVTRETSFWNMVAIGGYGGVGGGCFSIYSASGNQGTDGCGFVNNTSINANLTVIGGAGGAAGMKSGQSVSATIVSLPRAIPGTDGSNYGGGGGGAVSGTFDSALPPCEWRYRSKWSFARHCVWRLKSMAVR